MAFNDIVEVGAYFDNSVNQIYLNYDVEISNFKINQAESTITTLGGIYPIVRRNSKLNYKSFTISAKIIGIQLMKDLPEANDYDEMLDQVTADLQILQGVLKTDRALYFYTPVLGPMIVRLNNISFTQDKMIKTLYTFSANATEICAPTEENYNKYVIPPQNQEDSK